MCSTWSYIVDVLYECNIYLELIEVVDEGSVTRRSEEQLAIFKSERVSIVIDCEGVGGRVLCREFDLEVPTDSGFDR